MPKSIYWCSECKVPVIEQNACPRCGSKLKCISTNGICNPVFSQEKKLLSMIIGDKIDGDVWYLGNSFYYIDGKRIRVPYVDFFRTNRHQKVAQELRQDIVNDDTIESLPIYLEVNERYIRELIFEAEAYVIDLVRELSCNSLKKYVPTVSFSGGKDSTVVSRVVRDALQEERIIHFFGDTTLEFPATHEYVENVFRSENPFTPLIPSESDKDFYKLCNVFGPPSKFERWCCTIFKTGNLNSEYQNLSGNSLSFLGIRHSESKERKNYERTQTHSKIGSQINAMPIIEWNDCDVWLYILYKGIRFNNAYRWGYKRVGCWCCPNNSDWSTMLTEIYYPELSAKWKMILYDFARKTNKDNIEDYVENGKWKTRKGASGLETKNISIIDTPCNLSDRARNIIIKRKFERDVLEFFKPFGELSVLEKEEATYVTVIEKDAYDDAGIKHGKEKVCDLVIRWGTPVIKILPAPKTDLQLLLSRIKCQLRKYQFCIKCSACDSICPRGAISTIGRNRYHIDASKCSQNLSVCSRCIAKFYNGCITCQVLAGKKDESQ